MFYKRVKKLIPGRKTDSTDKTATDTADTVRITNETVAARRDEVLASARKYIYPLQASKHRVVRLSLGIFAVALISFFSFCIVELYRLQSTSSFVYGITSVLPFPVAVINNRQVVSYNAYLFELRRYMHYYQSQQHTDFSNAAGKQQLTVLKERSMQQALQDAYVQRLAHASNITVSEQDVDKAVALVRSQSRLGSNEQVFESVLSEFWGWSVSDFRRELSQELLAQKVVNALDVSTHAHANQVLSDLQHGQTFANEAKTYSDDQTTRGNGGDYGFAVTKSNTDIAPQVIQALFALHVGQYSGVLNTGYSLEIVAVNSVQGSEIRASHISFNFQPVTTYTQPLEVKYKPHLFIHT